MSTFAPAAAYGAEVREQLDLLARALTLRRAVAWSSRGLVLGLLFNLVLAIWAWTRESQFQIPVLLWLSLPLVAAFLAALSATLTRQSPESLARRVDNAAGLQERTRTALELGASGAAHTLALAQLRDTVEHLRRLEPLEVFPLRAPRNELLLSTLVTAITVMVVFAPNPWAVRARAANPAISAARDQAERVERLAASVEAGDSLELDQLRDLLQKGARTIEQRSHEPESALGAVEDLEQAIREMSRGDDQLQSALAAIASAMAGDGTTSELAAAIQTGDLREISRATRRLAEEAEQLHGPARERIARTLRSAAASAGRTSPEVAGRLDEAASALAGGSDDEDATAGAGTRGQTTETGEAGSGARGGRSAREALNDLSTRAGAAAERQRAQSQLESSRNALERALGRTQSRAAAGQGRPGATQRNQRVGVAEDEQGSGSGELGEEGAASMGEFGENGDGLGTGGIGSGSQPRSGVSDIDAITRPEQLPGPRGTSPDEVTENPYLGIAESGQANAREEEVATQFSRRSTQGGESAAIPLGLRDLVKDYFSALEQK